MLRREGYLSFGCNNNRNCYGGCAQNQSEVLSFDTYARNSCHLYDHSARNQNQVPKKNLYSLLEIDLLDLFTEI